MGDCAFTSWGQYAPPDPAAPPVTQPHSETEPPVALCRQPTHSHNTLLTDDTLITAGAQNLLENLDTGGVLFSVFYFSQNLLVAAASPLGEGNPV